MNLFKSISTSAFVCLFIFNINAQNNPDIGISLSTFNRNRINLDYRIPIKEKSKLVIGLAYGNYYSNIFYSGQIIAASDSLVTERHSLNSSNYFSVKTGFNRQINSSIFSVGVDCFFGYRNSRSSKSNSYTVLDSNGTWGAESNYFFDPFTQDSTLATVSRHYFEPRIQAGFNMDVPIGSSFLLHVGFAANVWTSFFVKSENKVDPYNEFNDPSSYYVGSSTQLSVGLRYVFGSKDINAD